MRIDSAFCLFVAISVCPGVTAQVSNLQSLFDAHEWFALGDAIKTADASPLYRGAVEAAFNQSQKAEKNLRRVIDTSPKSEDAYRAHELLTGIFVREMSLLRPEDDSFQSARTFCESLANPNEEVTKNSASSRLLMRDGNMVPISIAGKMANYGFDTGSNVSTMSELEAKRLGLIAESAGIGGGVGGPGVPIRAVVVPRLMIGNIVLSHVAFAVFSDKQEPFADLPIGERGILGLPVLLALKSFRWTKDGVFEIGPVLKNTDPHEPNLCFEGVTPAAQIEFDHSRLIFGFDTGADRTVLYPKFAADFPSLVKSVGEKDTIKTSGYDGSVEEETVRLPHVAFRIGNFDATLRPAQIVSHPYPNAGEFDGNLGMDLLAQAREVTVDFQSMTLTLR